MSWLVPVRFALLRLRAHAARSLVVAAGIAVAAAALALTAVGAVAVQDRAAQRALAQLQPSDRAVQAVWSGVPGQSDLSLPELDRIARHALRPVLKQPPFAVAVFRQATWGGAFVNLGAVDGLARWIVLHGGRLPAPCTPTHCEVVQIGGKPVTPKLPFLRVVGRATFRSGAPLSAYFAATGGNRPPILLANGVDGFAHTPLPDAAGIARTYGWIVPVAPGALHAWELPGFGARIDRAQGELEQATDLFSVSAPLDAIAATRATGRVAGERLLVLGGDAAVLLLGFAVLASTRLRRDHFAVRRRLTWLGARRPQILLVAATEVIAVTLAASVVGWAAGTGGGALLARHLGAPGALAVEHSVLTGRALAIGAALAAVTAVVMLAALRVQTISFGGLTLSVADVAALGALGAVLLALARGKADAAALSSSGTGVVLLLLPGLVLFVLAVAAARLLAPFLRLLEWSGRRAPAPVRLALLSLARAPGRVLLSVVFFVLSVGIALFAVAYRATLVRGEQEQARYAVPAPFVLQESLDRLVTVQQAATERQYASLGHATQVLRDSGFVSGGAAAHDFTLVALPAGALPRIDGWRSDFSARSPAELARLLAPAVKPALRGVVVPRGARRLTLPLDVEGDALGVTLVVQNPRGDFTTLSFGQFGRGRHMPTVAVPAVARGGLVVAVRLSFPVIAAFVAGHKESGTGLSVSDASRGVLRLGPLETGGRGSTFTGWIGRGGVRVSGGRIHYLLNRAADSILRPAEPLDSVPVPVVASPEIARAADAGGIVPLHVGDRTVEGQVVATARSFPSVDGGLVVADLATWLAAANTVEPGTTTPSELWLDAPAGAAARLARPPFSQLDVASQRTVETQLRGDPLARGALALLLVTGIVALGLAALGLLLTVVGDLRDESGELFDLEAQGATPRDLRRHLLLRAAVVAGLGLAGGLAAGAIVSALVVAVVTVTAGAGVALPPLELVYDRRVAVVALVVLAAASALAALLATHRAYERVSRWRFSEGIE